MTTEIHLSIPPYLMRKAKEWCKENSVAGQLQRVYYLAIAVVTNVIYMNGSP